MKLKMILPLAALVFMADACKNKKENTAIKPVDTVNMNHEGAKLASTDETQEKHISHWSYNGESGPEHWAELEKDSDCSGMRQSPINIIDIDAETDTGFKPLELYYGATTQIHEVINNGHSIQFNFEEGDYQIFNGEKYALKQFHFHEAAEHTINGIRYPIEIHLVHVNKKGKILVVGVMAEEGKSSQPFDFLEQFLPLQVGETKTVGQPFDMKSILPKNRSYYSYSGSLTTPPCSEGVIWIVMKNSITISVTQLKELQKLMPKNNYRNEQELNERIVSIVNE